MNKFKKAFSLVELSIVILIIGLLVAGISSGTKLIQQAELRSIISEFEEIQVAYKTFQATYDALPGDMGDASVFFSGCASGGAGNVNCNGNGDGYITFNMGNAYDGDQTGDEPSKVFRHLALAEIYDKGGSTVLPSNYSALGSFALDGYHARSDAVTGAYYVISNVDAGNTGGSAGPANAIYGSSTTDLNSNFPQLTNAIFMFNVATGVQSGGGIGKMDAFTAFQIDKKVDDGTTSGGNAIGANTGSFRTVTDITGANACVTGANYNITVTNETCVPGQTLD